MYKWKILDLRWNIIPPVFNLFPKVLFNNIYRKLSLIHISNFKFVRGDIADRDFVYSLFEAEKPDVVVNFACISQLIQANKFILRRCV